MSSVTCGVLLSNEDGRQGIDYVNAWLASTEQPPLEEVSSQRSGRKNFHGEVYIFSYNYLHLPDFLRMVASAPWDTPEAVRVYADGEEDESMEQVYPADTQPYAQSFQDLYREHSFLVNQVKDLFSVFSLIQAAQETQDLTKLPVLTMRLNSTLNDLETSVKSYPEEGEWTPSQPRMTYAEREVHHAMVSARLDNLVAAVQYAFDMSSELSQFCNDRTEETGKRLQQSDRDDVRERLLRKNKAEADLFGFVKDLDPSWDAKWKLRSSRVYSPKVNPNDSD